MTTIDSETRLVANPDQARELAQKLIDAADESEDGVHHVSQILEQSKANGPWRLIIHVTD